MIRPRFGREIEMLTMLIFAVVGILVVLVVGGILSWIVNKAPFVPAELKAAVVWVIWTIIALVFLVWLVQAVHNGINNPGSWRLW